MRKNIKRPPASGGRHEKTDACLPESLSEDREEQFRSIFDRHYGGVYSFFEKKGFSVEESADLAQETFLRVYTSLETFRRESSFETWLFRITANVYRNTLRTQSTRKRDAPEVSLDEIIDEGSEPETHRLGSEVEEAFFVQERSEVLRTALQDLPAQMRRCMELRVFHDLKYREVASLLRISIDTVKSQLFQARQLLSAKLGEYFTPPES